MARKVGRDERVVYDILKAPTAEEIAASVVSREKVQFTLEDVGEVTVRVTSIENHVTVLRIKGNITSEHSCEFEGPLWIDKQGGFLRTERTLDKVSA